MAGSDWLKERVREFWDKASCGALYAQGGSAREQLEKQAETRYALEPYLAEFARFSEGGGLDVLEVGVGMGADHLRWAESNPRSLTGVDLTERAVAFTRERLGFSGLSSDLRVADAEALPFEDNS